MNTLTRSTALIILALSFSVDVVAQEQDKPMPDKWRGLVIDQSTPEDAFRILGQPAKDKVGSLTVMDVGRWVSKRQKEKIFRNLEFKLNESVQKATLSFLDNKLVMITLDLKSGTVSPNGLSNIYGIPFQPIIGAMDLALFSKDYERNQGRLRFKWPFLSANSASNFKSQ